MREIRVGNASERRYHRIFVDDEGRRFSMEPCNLDQATMLVYKADLPPEDAEKFFESQGYRPCKHCLP